MADTKKSDDELKNASDDTTNSGEIETSDTDTVESSVEDATLGDDTPSSEPETLEDVDGEDSTGASTVDPEILEDDTSDETAEDTDATLSDAEPDPDADGASIVEAEIVETTEETAEDMAEAPTEEVEERVVDSPKEEKAQDDWFDNEPEVIQKGGFLPMLLGGVAAGVIGLGIGQFVNGGWPFGASDDDAFRAQIQQSLRQTETQVSGLSDRVDAAEGTLNGIDFTQIEKIPALETAVEGMPDVAPELAALSDSLTALEERLDALERRPVEESVSPEAIAAYERELENLRLAMEGQRAEIETMAKDAMAAEQSAKGQALLAQGRSALADVASALATGAPFDDALAQLHQAGFEVPQALSDVATDGAPTQSTLVEAFPPAARDALSTARSIEAEDATGVDRVGAFFLDRLGARSVTPREGTTADAILSRAEDDVKTGRIDAALEEISALPEAAQADMAEWVALAQTRRDALVAAEALTQELNSK